MSTFTAFNGYLLKKVCLMFTVIDIRTVDASFWFHIVKLGILDLHTDCIAVVISSSVQSTFKPGYSTFEMLQVGNQHPSAMIANVLRSAEKIFSSLHFDMMISLSSSVRRRSGSV